MSYEEKQAPFLAVDFNGKLPPNKNGKDQPQKRAALGVWVVSNRRSSLHLASVELVAQKGENVCYQMVRSPGMELVGQGKVYFSEFETEVSENKRPAKWA